MKYVILLMMITLAFGQDITSTKQYEALINKADTELQDAKKLRDAKVLRATVLYVKALEKKKKSIMAKGDLDKANKLDKEIKNLKPLLVKAVVAKPTKINIDIITTADREKALRYQLKRHPIGAKLGTKGHYYKYVKGFISWTDAYKKAKEAGGYLAVITTQDEYDFLAKYIKLQSERDNGGVGRSWIGGTMQNGVMRWLTGESDNKDIKRQQFANRYTHLNLHSLEAGITPAKPSGLNGTGVKLIRGYIIEWDN